MYRIGAANAYSLFYRYCEGKKESGAKMSEDILSDDDGTSYGINSREVHDYCARPDRIRQYHNGYPYKNGNWYFSNPSAAIQNKIHAFVDDRMQLPASIKTNHVGDYKEALDYSASQGFERFADQQVVSGSIQGHFIAKAILDDRTISISILTGCLLRDEKLFKTRQFTFTFKKRQNETAQAFRDRIENGDADKANVRDGFGATGASHGIIFFQNPLSGVFVSYRLNDYKWRKTGRSIMSLTANHSGDHKVRQHFMRVETPVQIEQVYRLFDLLN